MALGARGALGARRCGDVARRFHRRRRVRALAARARARTVARAASIARLNHNAASRVESRVVARSRASRSSIYPNRRISSSAERRVSVASRERATLT
jgi:hypothetical protein